MSSRRRRLTGEVVRATLQKTVTVRVNRTFRHPLYQKVLRRRTNYLVHDELGCQAGDQVRIVESRPISRRKRWAVEEILRRSSQMEMVE